jgi:putative drug exporter of the RND superfamily
VLFDFSIRRFVGRGGRGGVAAAHTIAPRTWLERWTSLVLRFRWVVVAAWLAVVGIGVYSSLLLPPHLVNSFAIRGTGSDRASAALARGFGDRPEGTFTVVFRVDRSSDKALQARLRRRLEDAARVLPGGRLGIFRAGGGVVYGDLQTALGLQHAKSYTEPLRAALDDDGGPRALVTGQPAIQHDLDPRLAADLRRGEAIAVPLAVLVLVLLLGVSAAAAVPFVFALCTISGTLALLFAAAHVVAITPYAANLVVLIGLGLAVDYSLLVVCRYREELGCAGTREEAIVRTVGSAGRAAVFSGVAVAIGLALLLFEPVPFIRTMGLAGLLIPMVTIVATLTVQPVLLSFCAPRAVTGIRLPRVVPWARMAGAIMRRPLLVLVPTAALLVTAALPMLGLRLTPGSLASLPQSNEAARGLVELRHSFGPGALTPTEVVVDAGRADGARARAVRAAVDRLGNELFHDPEVYVVALGRGRPYVSKDGRYARVFAIGRHEFGDAASRRLVGRIRERHVPAAGFPSSVSVSTGGAAPQGVDFLSRAYGFFPWLVAMALALTFVVLARAFRSLLLPLKAVLLNLLSVGASYGVLALAFGEVEGWIPIFLFATVFGLSMDYEVFLVSRMREAWDDGRDNAGAVAFGLERTGGLITGAALVMAASFGGFVVGSIPGLRHFGVGLVVAVLIDAVLVRALLLPALMAIMGRWNWWLPAPFSRAPALPLEVAVDS